MTISDWVSIATVAAGIGSVGSLIAVAWQLRSLASQTKEAVRQTSASTDAVRASVFLTTQQTAFEIDKFFFDHPDARAHIYGYIPGEGTQTDLHRMDATSELVLDMLDMIAAHEVHLPPDSAAGWRRYIQHVMGQSPHLRDFWSRNKSWYGRLRSFMEDGPTTCGSPSLQPADRHDAALESSGQLPPATPTPGCPHPVTASQLLGTNKAKPS